jgi:hypothetical protein
VQARVAALDSDGAWAKRWKLWGGLEAQETCCPFSWNRPPYGLVPVARLREGLVRLGGAWISLALALGVALAFEKGPRDASPAPNKVRPHVNAALRLAGHTRNHVLR